MNENNAAAPASPLPGGGWQESAQELADEIMHRAKTCEELITDDGDDFADGRVSGKAQAYKHTAELIRAFLARNGKADLQKMQNSSPRNAPRGLSDEC